MSKQKITPFLWFNNNAEEAMEFYAGIFKHTHFEIHSRWGENNGIAPAGTVMSASFNLEGQQFMALNAGPTYQFTEAISFFIDCDTQEEVDMYWEKLSAGGSKSRCGWLKDKFGLSWQVIPAALGRLLGSKEPGVSQKVMQAMMKMDKIIIADLEAAAKK
ncbi:MAG TPA: VOC family protein [Chitinophagaceae bacterium]|nr:VOC family protein [Chitinophagaceae bacterium]